MIGFLQAGKQSDIRRMLRLAVSARENRQTGQSGQDASPPEISYTTKKGSQLPG